MAHRFRLRGTPVVVCSLIFLAGLTGCASISGDDEATAPFGVEVSQLFITIENRTGTALVDGRIEILPFGPVTFTTSWPRMEISERRDFMLNIFRGSDGTPFRRGVVRARRVKVSARDLAGTLYEREVPFD